MYFSAYWMCDCATIRLLPIHNMKYHTKFTDGRKPLDGREHTSTRSMILLVRPIALCLPKHIVDSLQCRGCFDVVYRMSSDISTSLLLFTLCPRHLHICARKFTYIYELNQMSCFYPLYLPTYCITVSLMHTLPDLVEFKNSSCTWLSFENAYSTSADSLTDCVQ